MTDNARALRLCQQTQARVREAVEQARLAYEFAANSYTFAAMNACVAAEQALEVLRAALGDEFADQAA
jgi:hypothetical protein